MNNRFIESLKNDIQTKTKASVSDIKRDISEGYYDPQDHFKRPTPSEEEVLHRAMKTLGPTPENPLPDDAFNGSSGSPCEHCGEDTTCKSCGNSHGDCPHCGETSESGESEPSDNEIDSSDPNAVAEMKAAAEAGHEIEIHFDDHDNVFQIDGHVVHELFKDTDEEVIGQALKSYERFNALLSDHLGSAGWEEVEDGDNK